MSSDERQPIAIDLFCGVGGLSLGFKRAGFDVVASFDLERRNVETYKLNFPDARAIEIDLAAASGKDIRRLAGIRRRSIDVVFGGPPCQGFSVGGRRQSTDPRNRLLLHFARLVVELKPRYFVAENVEGLLRGYGNDMVDKFCRILKKGGYSVIKPIRVLDAAQFGIPQRRRRAFVLGFRSDVVRPQYPEPALATDRLGNSYFPTVGDAISDLPLIEAIDSLLTSDGYSGKLGVPSEYVKHLRSVWNWHGSNIEIAKRTRMLTGCLRTKHSSETIRRFIKTKPGTSEPISRYYRLHLDRVAPTLRAGTGKDKGSHTAPRPIHPTEPRCITVREAARLHSFPDWFQFHETRWHAFRQIGNSVPPVLSYAVANAIATLF